MHKRLKILLTPNLNILNYILFVNVIYIINSYIYICINMFYSFSVKLWECGYILYRWKYICWFQPHIFSPVLSRLCNSITNLSFDLIHWDSLVERHYNEIKFPLKFPVQRRRESSYMTAQFQSEWLLTSRELYKRVTLLIIKDYLWVEIEDFCFALSVVHWKCLYCEICDTFMQSWLMFVCSGTAALLHIPGQYMCPLDWKSIKQGLFTYTRSCTCRWVMLQYYLLSLWFEMNIPG